MRYGGNKNNIQLHTRTRAKKDYCATVVRDNYNNK